MGDVTLLFLARHGKGHTLLPHEVPYLANIYALKSLGAQWLLAVSAVGSLREAIAPMDMVVVDQYIDRTQGRKSTFFGDGCVAHVSFGDPTCPVLRGMLVDALANQPVAFHDGGTYVCMQGPAFSTRAESEMYRGLGGHVIGMTNLPEAKLAREACISYASLAMATDYDAWRTGHPPVTTDEILSVLSGNADRARNTVVGVVHRLATHEQPTPLKGSLRNAVMTPMEAIPPATKARLSLLLDEAYP
jgi:5'-methylthioadenosine phosphorylase